MEESLISEEKRYTAPWFPAIAAFSYHYSYLWFIPFWIILFVFYLVKDKLIYDGVASVDWTFLILWIPSQFLSQFFGMESIKLPNCSNFWVFIFCSITAMFFTIYFFSKSSTILFLEFHICVISFLIQLFEFLFAFVSFFIQRRPVRIQPE